MFSHNAVQASRFSIVCGPIYLYISIPCSSFKQSLGSYIFSAAHVSV